MEIKRNQMQIHMFYMHFDVRVIKRGSLYDDKVATRGRKCGSATH